MQPLRWAGSDQQLLDGDGMELLAAKVGAEIGIGQYDGYKCVNKHLSDAIAGALATLTIVYKWLVYADFDESKQVYRGGWKGDAFSPWR
ncbi:hypothetical protein LLE49_23555 [Alicyclobacillus tolerans]|uniref:hypothetical protein n=1 Tax=Alicyclobacillus tolerans TaxID=90970 RepID=UPI001F192365|nr:hypothetical protein [Alicyclobacillus tolerans]MCF8567700.1 hypothetical protein [Alicyclobacillus tolerans]